MFRNKTEHYPDQHVYLKAECTILTR